MTQSTQAVLRALLEDPGKERYDLEICAATGLPSGTVHPILARLERLNWVDSASEQTDPREQGRPRRRYYRLNAEGLSMAREAPASAYETRARLLTRLRPAGETS